MKIGTTDKLLSLVFGLMAFLFFAFLYPFHLNYQEQYQLFLFSNDYLLQYIGKPGGFSDYSGNFLTQFFFYSWVGALIIATLLTLLQRAVWFVSNKLGATTAVVPATFIPPLLYWGLLCDENYLMGGLVVMLITAAFICCYTLIRPNSARVVFGALGIPVLFWAVGGAFLLFPLFILIREASIGKLTKIQLSIFAVASISLSYALPTLSKAFLLQYPLRQVWIGANYYRFPVNVPVSVGVIALLIGLLPFLLTVISKKLKAKSTILIVLQLLILIPGSAYFISSSADLEKEEVMAYDFNVRMRRWDHVIALADKKAPTSPLSVTCLNLALAQEGLLGERMFSYYQNGIQGLMPDFIRDFTIPMISNEVYYHLGFINTAQRYAFEAMEALPDYQKSVRSVKRLAETNLINGEYAVATKYLRLLQETFYYNGWATQALQTMKDESKIAEHPEWGWLRNCRPGEDFLFSEGEKDMMLGVLFNHNNENRMAFEYLMAFCLLNKDLQHFNQYFPLAKTIKYKAIPKSYQEALIYIWGLRNTNLNGEMPFPISNPVRSRVQNYRNIYTSQANAEPLLQRDFADTYWYYLHFRK